MKDSRVQQKLDTTMSPQVFRPVHRSDVIIRSQSLLKSPELKVVLNTFSKEITEDAFLGSGGDASTFSLCDDLVLKLCSKKINYFDKYGGGGLDFLIYTQKLSDLLFPVTSILYEGNDLLVYTQAKCQHATKVKTPRVMYKIMKIIYGLFEKKLYFPSVDLRSAGLYQNKVRFFDYHDIGPLEIRQGRIVKDKWDRFVKNIKKYLSYFNESSESITLLQLLESDPIDYDDLMELFGSWLIRYNPYTS